MIDLAVNIEHTSLILLLTSIRMKEKKSVTDFARHKEQLRITIYIFPLPGPMPMEHPLQFCHL